MRNLTRLSRSASVGIRSLGMFEAILGLMAALLLAKLTAHSLDDPIHTDVSQIAQPPSGRVLKCVMS